MCLYSLILVRQYKGDRRVDKPFLKVVEDISFQNLLLALGIFFRYT